MTRAWPGAVALLLLASAAGADDTLNRGPVAVSMTAGAQVTITDGKDDYDPVAFVEVDGPLPFGNKVILRGFSRLGVTTTPGQTAGFSDVRAFRSLNFAAGLYHIHGEYVVKENE